MSSPILFTQRLQPQDRDIVAELAAPLGGAALLADIPENERTRAVQAAKAVMSFHPTKELGAALSGLRPGQLLQTISAGLDHLPFADLPQGLIVAGNSGAYARPMSEHALALVLALAKRLPQEDAAMRRGEFNQWVPNTLLSGKKAAVLGLGGAGTATARLLSCLGMAVWGMNTSGRTDAPVAFIGTLADLEAILTDAQVVVLTLPYTRFTRNVIGARELALMPDDAILVNVARGELVDQKALYAHLAATPTFRAGLESWWVEPQRHGRFELEYPLLDLPNVLACPHNSWNVPENRRLALTMAFDNVRRFLEGKPLTGLLRPELHAL